MENSYFKTIFGIYFKTNKKRLILAIITSIIVFTLLTTFLLTWSNYRYKYFSNSVELNDWRKDNEISIEYYSGLNEKIQTYSDYFSLAVNEIISVTDEIAPEMFNNFTACMFSQILSQQYEPLIQSYDTLLLTLQQDVYEFLGENLVEGRMPNNKTELLYSPYNTTSPTYNIGDEIGLLTSSQMSPSNNFTIVGILGNLSSSFYQKGYSYDVLNYINNFQISYDEIDYLFASPQNFADILKFDLDISSQELYLLFDFNYQFTIDSLRSLEDIANMINQIQSNYQNYQYLPSSAHFFCLDLEDFIYSFLNNWNDQTVQILSSGIPVILLLSFIFTEIFNIGNFEKGNQFRLLKLYGIEYRTIQKMILIESIILSSIALFIGVIFGILFGYLFTLGIGITNFGFYLNASLEVIVIVPISILFAIHFVGGFIIEVSRVKNTVQLTPEIFKSKRRKLIHKFFTSKETLLLIIGIINFGIGLIGWIILESNFYTVTTGIPKNYILYNSLDIFFRILILLGILLLLVSILIFFSRLIVLMWRYFGEWAWKRRKNYFTLALKQLSVSSKDYQKAILVMFTICLCIVPGLIVPKSVDNHLKDEANLGIGLSDLLIQGWNGKDTKILQNISAIDGIELNTEVELITIEEARKGYDVVILNIFNISDFVDVISPKFPDDLTMYDLEDIAQLEIEMSYMMSSKYAHKEHYDRGRIYTSSDITDPAEEPYNMTFINKFDVFPLLQQTTNYFSSLQGATYSLVMSNLTVSQLKKKFEGEPNNELYYILANISPDVNKTAIIEEIESLSTTLTVETYEERLQILLLGMNDFRISFFTIVMIISFIVLLFFSFLTAKNIYNQRVRITESKYNAGAKRSQIWGNFSIEFLLVIFIPLIISIFISSILSYELLGYLLEIPQIYKEFVPWLPVWLMGLIILLCIVVTSCGWLYEMIKLVNQYKPVRQE